MVEKKKRQLVNFSVLSLQAVCSNKTFWSHFLQIHVFSELCYCLCLNLDELQVFR